MVVLLFRYVSDQDPDSPSPVTRVVRARSARLLARRLCPYRFCAGPPADVLRSHFGERLAHRAPAPAADPPVFVRLCERVNPVRFPAPPGSQKRDSSSGVLVRLLLRPDLATLPGLLQ